MDYSTDIKFSSNLIEDETVRISYSGFLANYSDTVNIVYGFGDNWEKTSEQQMTKDSDGSFYADIKILSNYLKFNFCFRNQDNQWDNNLNTNYITLIEKKELDYFINTNQLSSIVDNLYNVLQSNVEETNSTFEVEPEINNIENSNLEDTINEVVASKDISINVSAIENISIEETEQSFTIENNLSDCLNDTIQEIENIDDASAIDLEEIINLATDNESEQDYVAQDVLEALTLTLPDFIIKNEESQNTVEITEENQETSNVFDTVQSIQEESINVNALIDEILSPISRIDNIEFTSDTVEKEITVEQIEEAVENFEETENIIAENPMDNLIENIVEDIQEKSAEFIASKEIADKEFQEFNSVFDEIFEEQEDNLFDSLNNEYSIDEVSSEDVSLAITTKDNSLFGRFARGAKVAFNKIFKVLPSMLSRGYNEDQN